MTATQPVEHETIDQPAPESAGWWARLFPPRTGVAALTWSLVGLLLLYAAALFVLRPASPGQFMTLDRVLNAALRHDVKSARFLDEDARITGTMTATRRGKPTEFWTSYPRSDAATNDILRTFFSSGTSVTVDSQSTKALVRFVAQFLLPLVILANLFALLFYLARGSGGGGGTSEFLTFSRIGDRRVELGQKERTTFADVAASEESVAELSEVRDYLEDPQAFEKMGALPPKGVLIMGPPGCGKTLLARAVAGETNATFFSISGSEFVESLVGVGAARVRDLFGQARATAPSILFIDELDAVGRQRGAGLGGGHDEREQTLNELLVQMDGFSASDGVAVLAATNRPDILDPALLRPGRFDRQLTVERPDLDGRLAILRLHGRRKRLADFETDLPVIAQATPGFTGADLAAVLNEAALLAVRERSGAIFRHHLEEAVERVVAGPRRKATIMSPDDKHRTAYHEAGHAIVAAGMGKAPNIQKVSVISRGRGIGHLAMLSADTLLPTREDMEAQIAIAMAGISAEEITLGQPSVGSEQDLERSTNIARDMAGRYGMSDRLGRVRVLREHREVFLGRDYLSTKDVSEPTLEHLDLEVRRILDEQEAVARSILLAHRGALDALAEKLMTQETVADEELREALSRVRAVVGRNGEHPPSGVPAARARRESPRH